MSLLLINKVIASKEIPIDKMRENLKTYRTERAERVERPLTQNYMIVHKKNANSNDGRIRNKEQFYNEYNKDNKELYDDARKNGKRPKSSSNSQGPNKKVSTKKPIVFSTIDNRAPTSLMTQKFSWKDINSHQSNLISSPTESPSKRINKQIYEMVDVTNRPKVRSSKQPMSIKTKNESQTKSFKPFAYTYKGETSEQYKYKQPREGSKKNHPKTERHKFKLNSENIVQMVEANTLNSARELQSNLADKSAGSTMKWTLKSREHDKSMNKNRNIDDFEKLFYQSMSNEKGKIITQSAMDLSHLKSFKIQSPTTYRSLSKQSKVPKVAKQHKKSFKMYESKGKKSKRVSPSQSKYKHR